MYSELKALIGFIRNFYAESRRKRMPLKYPIFASETEWRVVTLANGSLLSFTFGNFYSLILGERGKRHSLPFPI